MKRREFLKGLGALMGFSVATPGMAFDLGKAVGAVKSLGSILPVKQK
jgi:hypothetical protein